MNTNGKPVTIADRHAAEALAEQILDPRRLFPLVVVTTPAGRTDPYVPAAELIDAISHRADVVAVTQQASNWLSTRLEELGRSDLNVYGGATRLYPTGPLDADLAPIFTARTEADGIRVVANVSNRVGGTFTTSTPEPEAVPAPTPQLTENDAEIARLRLQAEGLAMELTAARQQIEGLSKELSTARQLASKTRKQQRTADLPMRLGRYFIDTCEDMHYRITTTWAEQIPAEQKVELPLAPFTFSGTFAASVEEVAGTDPALRDKIARACVRVLTRQDRDAHRLGPEREDGASAWRSYVEQKAASARRLHYWAMPGGAIELARVVLHDDYRI